MPTESAPPPPLSRTPSLYSPYKCDRCGARCVAGTASTSGTSGAHPTGGLDSHIARPGGALGRSYSDTVRFGSDHLTSEWTSQPSTVHEQGGQVGGGAEDISARDTADALICGTCAATAFTTELTEQRDVLTPLTALSGAQSYVRVGEADHVPLMDHVGSIGAVGLGLSLGRAVNCTTSPTYGDSAHVARGGGDSIHGGDMQKAHGTEAEVPRPVSVSSDTSSGSANTPDLADLCIASPLPAAATPLYADTDRSQASRPVSIPATQCGIEQNHSSSAGSSTFPQSLPNPAVRPWSTAKSQTCLGAPGAGKGPAEAAAPDTGAGRSRQGVKHARAYKDASDRPYQPLLDVTTERVSNVGRGALYAGSVFKGTQTSGRSAYDVEIRFLEVNLPLSTCSGYLTISNLTDTHPMLTTFFNAELIGEQYGFLTGGRWGASEHDDLRHWGRFEQFRRPATRADMIRPELLLRDPVPVIGGPSGAGAGAGEGIRGVPKGLGTGYVGVREGEECGGEVQQYQYQVKGRERDFVFMRIKEKFLVPDHSVKDISGASFAGFYYAMLDLTPPAEYVPYTSPVSPKTPLPTAPLSPVMPTTANSAWIDSGTPSDAYDTAWRSGVNAGGSASSGVTGSTSAGITSYFSSAFGRRASAATASAPSGGFAPSPPLALNASTGMGTMTTPDASSAEPSATVAVAGGRVVLSPPPTARRSSSSAVRLNSQHQPSSSPSAGTGTSPSIPASARRASTSTHPHTSSGSSGPAQMPIRRRRESSSRTALEGPREATIRGYYFHSLNQEPFQELCLTHVPNKSSGTFELR